MQGKKIIDNSKLGLLVIAGLVFLVLMLYLIGRNQNLFGTSIRITAMVENVNGLVPGNNVRFKGMNIGTVRSINMENDTSIFISLAVSKRMKPFIKKNSLTTINTDGLMGNKILQIVPQLGDAPFITEGDTLFAKYGPDTEELLRTLESTGDYLEKTFLHLSNVALKLDQSDALWGVLSDQEIAEELKLTVNELRIAGAQISGITSSGRRLIQTLEKGEGLVHQVFLDTLLANDFSQSIDHLLKISEDTKNMMGQVKEMLERIDSSQGAAWLILEDSLLKETIMSSMQNIEEGTASFSENMEAMRSNFLFRRHFRRLERQQQRELKQSEGVNVEDGNREEN